MYKFGPVQKKILLVLMGGIVLGMSSSPTQYYRALRALRKDWKKVNQQNFKRTVRRLATQKLLTEVTLADGSFRLELTKEGKRQARLQALFGKTIDFKKVKRWDRKWRLVIFDIPEKERSFRDVLRQHLKNLRFYKLQQSVFVTPFPFEAAVLELIELYGAKEYVRVVTASKIDNEKKLKNHFFKI